jgi:hypothetical protein
LQRNPGIIGELLVGGHGFRGASERFFGYVGDDIDTDLGFYLGWHDIVRDDVQSSDACVKLARQLESGFESVVTTTAVV